MSLDPTCIICQNDMDIACTTHCGHTTCYECVIKYFVMEGKSTCILCREEDPKFAFYKFSPDVEENHQTCSLKGKVGNKNFLFKNKAVYEQVEKLMLYQCPLDKATFKKFKGFNDHLKSHKEFIKACHLCGQSNHHLPSETKTFRSIKDYEKHRKQGDPKSGFEGHPACMFCTKERFYSDDELKKHMDKSTHAYCFICKKIPSIPDRQCWFENSLKLNSHLKQSHYSCSSDECPLIAFETKAELEFHNVEKHGKVHPDFAFFNEDESQIIRYTDSSQTTNEKTTYADKSEAAMRKLRFRERARHYWGHDKERMDLFEITNDCFIKKEISINELCHIYEEMLDKETNKIEVENKISLLLQNFADYIKDKQDLRKILLKRSKALNHMPDLPTSSKDNKKTLPALKNTSSKRSTLSKNFVEKQVNSPMSSLNISNKVPSLPTLPGLNNSALFNNSQFYNVDSNYKSTSDSKKTLPTLSSMKTTQSPLFSKPVKTKNIISGAGRGLLSSKNGRSNLNTIPGMLPLNSTINTQESTLLDNAPGYASLKSLQVIPNTNERAKTQVISHANVNRLPGLPTLKSVQSDETKKIKLRIKQKNTNKDAVDMSSDYQDRLNAIRTKTTKLEEKNVLKSWANI